jgi:glycosyltransferase involved in cell wall biosynthesis
MNKSHKSIDAIIPIKNNSVVILNICKVIRNATQFNIRCIVILDGFSKEEVINFKNTLGEIKNSDMVRIKSGIYGSPGSARNAGLEISSSKWITFWDADDYPNPKAISNALEIYSWNQIPIIGQFQMNSIDTKTVSIYDVAINPGIWRILFPKTTVATLRFSEKHWGEDQLFIAQTELLINNAKIVAHFFYNYQTGLSNQLTQNQRNVNDGIKSLIDIYEFNLKYRGSNKNLESQLIPIIKLSTTALKRFIFLDNIPRSLWQLLKINFLTFLYFKKNYIRAIYIVAIQKKSAE